MDISDPLERKFLVTDLQAEASSDEEDEGNIESDQELSDEDSDARGIYDKDLEVRVETEEKEWQKYMSNTPRRKHNTGPKGVKADYEEARQIMRRLNETKILKAREAVRASAGVLGGPSISYNSVHKKGNKNQMSAIDEGNYNDPELQNVLENMKKLRFQEFKAIKNLPKFGRLEQVDKFKFIEIIEAAHPETFVVIHLFEDYVLSCKRLNLLLQEMASTWQHIRFLLLQATDLDPSLSHSVLPGMMVYKGGEIVNDIVIDFPSTVLAPLGVKDMSKLGKAEFEWFLSSRFGMTFPGSTSGKETAGALEGIVSSDTVNNVTKKTWDSFGFSSTGGIQAGKGQVNKVVESDSDSSDGDW